MSATGQVITAGTPLVTLSIAQGRNGVAAQLSEIANQDAELAGQVELAGEIGTAEERRLAQQRESLVAAIASLERQRGIAADKSARRGGDTSCGPACQAGGGTSTPGGGQPSNLLARRAEVEAFTERLIAQREALRAAEAQLPQRSLETNRTRSILIAQRAALAEQRAELMRTDRLVLTAPIDGEVGDVSVEVGQRARIDRSLVTIVPRGSRLEVWLYAPSRAVGFARPGQQVRLFFDAFPYQKYGAGRGTITAVSRVPRSRPISTPTSASRSRSSGFGSGLMNGPGGSGRSARDAAGNDPQRHLVQEQRSLWQVLFGLFVRRSDHERDRWPWSRRMRRCCNPKRRNAGLRLSR